ncbi:MAG TPA: rod-binding protein [Candidatus Acidoferrum sp.]|jgi:Rod binding domain-containing protein
MMFPIDSYESTIAANSSSGFSQIGKSTDSSSISNTPEGRKLQQAAAQFEGMLLSSLWKSMKSTFASPDDDSDDPAHDTLDDLSTETMSNAVAKAGGLGLGKLILKHLEPMLAQRQAQRAADSGKGSAPPADNL